jgi:hypothetical protein
MVRTCIACSNREGLSQNVTFHCLPTDTNLRYVWLKRLNRLDLTNFSNRRVCSHHFSTSSFKMKSKKNANANGRTRLKFDALPIEIEPTTTIITTTTQSRSVAVQTDLDMTSLTTLFDKLTLLEQNYTNTSICIERFQNDDVNIKYYTGFKSYNIFEMVFELLEVSKLTLKNMICL